MRPGLAVGYGAVQTSRLPHRQIRDSALPGGVRQRAPLTPACAISAPPNRDPEPQPALRPRCERQTCPVLSPIYAVDECISSPSLDRAHPLYEAHTENLGRQNLNSTEIKIARFVVKE